MKLMTMKVFLSLLYLSRLSAGEPSDLVTYSLLRGAPELCCKEDNLLHCSPVTINPEILATREEIKLLGIDLSFSNAVEPQGLAYKSKGGDEVVITYNEQSGNMFGTLSKENGDTYMIEKCHNSHVIKRYNESRLELDEDEIEESYDAVNVNDQGNFQQADSSQRYDDTTIVEFSIMFYFTPDFEKFTADKEGYFDQQIAGINQAFINSQMPIRVRKFCSEIADVKNLESGGWLEKFRAFKGSDEALRNTADFAALFTMIHPGSGLAYAPGTISVNGKSNTVFRHELGHNFGGHHYRGTGRNPYNSGHGAAETILGGNKINYYSNPRIDHPELGIPLGIENVADMARYTTERRYEIANVGSESRTCPQSNTVTVNCGGHRALMCEKCPEGNGASWCNGDCVWSNNRCSVKPVKPTSPVRPVKKVNCGNHKARSCEECPQGNGASWCNGQCSWRDNRCRDRGWRQRNTLSDGVNFNSPQVSVRQSSRTTTTKKPSRFTTTKRTREDNKNQSDRVNFRN